MSYWGEKIWPSGYWASGYWASSAASVPAGSKPALVGAAADPIAPATAGEISTAILKRLGDASETIWTEDEIIEYINEGYRLLTTEALMLWSISAIPDWDGVFTYTQAWEIDYMNAEFLVAGPASSTHQWERDYTNNAGEPRSHTAYWEESLGHVTDIAIPAVEALPSELHTMDRASWNTRRIDPIHSRDVEMTDGRYEINTGIVEAYARDKDGLQTIRKWRKPSSAYVPYAPTGQWGILRQVDDISDEEAIGAWGLIRILPGQESTDVFGEPHPYKDNLSVRIEYFRRPSRVEAGDRFEIAGYYLKYLRHFAMWRALEREGDGQDIRVADHHRRLWAVAVERTKKRIGSANFQKGHSLKGAGDRRRKSPRAKLPWQYGETIR